MHYGREKKYEKARIFQGWPRQDAAGAAQGAHALCLVTAWKQYWSPDFKQLQQLMQHPLILDGRNIYDPAYVKSKGFAYEGVGRL